MRQGLDCGNLGLASEILLPLSPPPVASSTTEETGSRLIPGAFFFARPS